MPALSQKQIEVLLGPINEKRVLQANGQSHIPAYDVGAHLTRIFGFAGWDKEILSLNLVLDEPTTTNAGKPAWAVTYSCTLRLTIKDEFGNPVAHWEDGSCGSSTQTQHGEAHDMAMKSAISYALKRCAAFGLGDQFGLSLYNKGSVLPLIGKTLVMWPEPDGAAEGTPDLQSHIPVPLSIGNDEREELPVDEAATSIQRNGELPDFTPLQREIKAHPNYVAMASEAKGKFLADTLGYEVVNIKFVNDADCEQVLAKLRTL